MKLDDKVSIEYVDEMWEVRGGRTIKVKFVRLSHACKFVVDGWASDAAKRNAASLEDVMGYLGDRLHDVIKRIGLENQYDEDGT